MAQAPSSPAQAPLPQHRPVLVGHPNVGHADQKRHILLPVDDTEDSEHAIEWAIRNVFRPGDIFHLLHVIPEPTMVHVWGGVYVPPDEDAELMEVEDTKLFVSHRFAQKLVAAQVPFKLHVIVGPVDSDSVAQVIEHKAQEIGAVSVVLARHTKGRLKEMWVGSVTKAVTARASLPVVVVPHS